MSNLMVGLIIAFVVYGLFILTMVAIIRFIPKSFLGESAKAALTWLPPFLRGEALQNWAATIAEQSTQECLADKKAGETGTRLATEVEEIAMHAMLPLADPADLERVVACPEAGQGLVGVTAPEVLAIAAFIRKHKSRSEQNRIHELAVANAEIIASRPCGDSGQASIPCALQGQNHVCCAYGVRPLRCRPLHASSVATEISRRNEPGATSPARGNDVNSHEQTVAQGIEIGMTRALQSAGLDANVYELNSALATALENPDAEERWARGESVFHDPLPTPTGRSAASDQSV